MLAVGGVFGRDVLAHGEQTGGMHSRIYIHPCEILPNIFRAAEEREADGLITRSQPRHVEALWSFFPHVFKAFQLFSPCPFPASKY